MASKLTANATAGLHVNSNIQVNEYMKDHILNCGERYEFMVDHRSYTHNLIAVILVHTT